MDFWYGFLSGVFAGMALAIAVTVIGHLLLTWPGQLTIHPRSQEFHGNWQTPNYPNQIKGARPGCIPEPFELTLHK